MSWMRQHKGFHVGLATRNNPAAVDILVKRFEWPEPGFSPILTRVLKLEEDVPQVCRWVGKDFVESRVKGW